MTRAEAEADVRKYLRECKGPLLVDSATQTTFAGRINTAQAEDLPQLVADVIALRRTVGLPKKWAEELEAGDPWSLPSLFTRTGGQILAWCLESIRAHQRDIDGVGCGRDFNDEVCAMPFDGQERAYTCPNCGLTGTYRSPLYEIT